ncbi:Protein transport protein SEC9 [Cyphellophora attinorum]|uniref:Protein transport protein SEC9 n=1 Tax=Cyphellophora attinorum TaxID=1664694 RepID=A0A0N1HAD4_9EURO|nr:Protein transport protein SEC9 [Phialophora attinorum]KPI44826.1 Protein transport protein SEC9 [Phialophora attinorum]
MGFLKKKDGDDDSNRNALFSSKGKSKSPAPQNSNPYAQAAIPPDPYTRAKMNAGGGYGSMSQAPPNRGYGQQPSAYDSQAGGYPNNRYGAAQGDNKYQGGGGGGYAPDRYANQGAYGGASSGGNPYGAPQPSGAARSGGYGGLGRTASYETTPDDNRDALFGGAAQRLEQRQQQGPPDYAYQSQDQSGGDTSYGAYGDRQLTAEEEEEEDIQASKSEIKSMKQQDVASTRNALRIAAQAEETGRNTLARLGAQGERMHNTDRNLDIANNQVSMSDDKQKELKKLNRSMFAVHVGNPFNSKARQQEKDDKIMERHRLEREQREATREQAFRSTQRMNHNFKGLDDTYSTGPRKTNLAERSKYQFEADSDDDRMEDEIDRNLDDLTGAAKRLNLLAKATGQEIESQNKLIEGISDKVRPKCLFVMRVLIIVTTGRQI